MSPGALAIGVMVFICGCSTPAIIATKSVQEGDRLNNVNRYDDAILHYEEYLRVSPQLGLYRNPSKEADVLRKLAYAYSTQGKYRQSFSYLSKALAIDSTLSTNSLEVINDYRELGVVKAYMGDYPEAIRYLNTSLHMSEGMDRSLKDNKKTSLADTYLSLAQVNLTLGNFKEAADFGRNALDIYSDTGDETAGLIECYLLLGIVHRDRGNLPDAVNLITASADVSTKAGLNTARQHQALGEVYFLQGESEKGIREQMLAIEEAEKSQIKPMAVMMYMRLGDAYQKLGDQVKAEYFYQKAMAVKVHMDADTLSFISSGTMRFAEAEKAYQYYTRSGAVLGAGLVSLRLGELRARNDALDSAGIMFTAALEAFEKAGSNEGVAKALLELAKINIQKKEFGLGERKLAQSRERTLQPDLLWQIELHKGVIEESRGAIDSAYTSYKKAIRIIEDMRGHISIEEFKTLFANTKVEAYDRLIALLLGHRLNSLTRDQAAREAFICNEQSRSRTFLDMLGNRKIEAKNIADTALLEKEQLLRLKIQQLGKQQVSATNSAGAKPGESELERAYREYDHVLSAIKLNNPAYSTVITVEPPAITEIQNSLDAESAIVEYWVSSESIVIWVLTKDNLVAKSIPFSRPDLQRLIKGARNGISYRDEKTTKESLMQLYQLLVAPVENEINEYDNLIVVPHRMLHFLPFQALLSGKRSFLAEDFVITYAPASSIFYYCLQREKKVEESFLGMALGDLSLEKHPTLPGTKTEVELLSQLYPRSQSKYGVACDETYIKKNVSDYGYIHIATHGVFNEQEPVYSYLLMAPTEHDDGKLTVHEIFGLDIRSRFVTLSACETALGELSEGDELVGLSRAFIYAGSSAVLVSLWKVEDSSTALLMTRFHQYLTSGKTAAQALSLAQRDLIHKKLTADDRKDFRSVDVTSLTSSINTNIIDNPFFWAPFILVGNGQVK